MTFRPLRRGALAGWTALPLFTALLAPAACSSRTAAPEDSAQEGEGLARQLVAPAPTLSPVDQFTEFAKVTDTRVGANVRLFRNGA
jgi:hypothetical protein